MKFKLKLLNAALLTVCFNPIAVQAVGLTIIADTHLAATNAGTSVAVNINAGSKGLLNFDMSSLPAGITSADIAKATLVFYVKTVTTRGQLQISPLTAAWTENTVTSTNAPTEGLPLATSAIISNSNTYFAVDVTNLMMNWVDVPSTNYGLALEPLASTTTSLTLDSKEAIQTSHPAYIEIALKGPAGDKGATGPQGIQGPIGLTGSSGVNGTNGVDGAKGDTGLTGPQGLTGATGPQGAMPVGNAAGDMQYWNGSAWINIAAGLPSATFKICNGVPTWTTTNCLVLKIGDTGPAGGKVFYLTDTTGLHGLEAAPTDQSDGIIWGCLGKTVVGTKSVIGTGKANTAAIIARCEPGTAAQIAASYSLNGFTDWYLPSKDELNLLYAQQAVVGGFAWNTYWSSTEYDRNIAWSQGFHSGGQYNNTTKNWILPVRAVRAF
jgi:hypothetical protein